MVFTLLSLAFPFPAPQSTQQGPWLPSHVCVWLVLQAGKHSCWRIEPSKGVVPPNTQVSVEVIANLNDTEKFQDKVKVFVENSPTTSISVQAVGIGTTIVLSKPLLPKLDLKSHFR